MEHSPPRKRKASQSSPIQDHRCIPQQDSTADCTPSVDPSPLYSIDEGDTPRPKRPRLSLPSPPPSRSRRTTPSRRRRTTSQPQPQPQLHDIYPTPQYLLHRRTSLPRSGSSLLSPLTESPVAPSPVAVPPDIYLPPLFPTITRDTLCELDLDAILRNPQLRHDLLFDPGLQFRPTTGRRKQLAADRYWVALEHEIEHGCTCAAWDVAGEMITCGCCSNTTSLGPWPERFVTKAKRTRPPTPPPWSERYYTAYLDAAADPRFDDVLHTEDKESKVDRPRFNVPSRVGSMLREFIAVLKCVIMPPSFSSPTASTRPSPLQPSLDAENLLSHIDPSLIEQELQRGIFDPVGLFGLVGETLKRHCAPMRDRQVDAMVAVVRSAEGTVTHRAVMAMRMCFEILELMKLDIANHQLQHLRPFLATSTPDFELRVFVERCRRGLASPRVAREWLQSAWTKVMASPVPAELIRDHVAVDLSTKMDVDILSTTIPHASPLSRRLFVQLSLINAITGLIFNPPARPSDSSLSILDYPETLYLDTARVALLAADAADLTALYMLLMLWRQLVFWSPSVEIKKEEQSDHVFPRYARSTPRLGDWEVDRVKREIWEVGPRRIGSCFTSSGGDESAEGEDRIKWTLAMQNVALQIAMRAEEARTCTSSGPAPADVLATTRRPPSQEALGLMSGWIQSHMRRDSALAGRLRELLRQEVAHAVTSLTFTVGSCNQTVPGSNGVKTAFTPGSGGGTAGLEPLMPEIRHLAQRLAKLVLVNMRVYWSLYEAKGFLVDKTYAEAC